ncbi:MAG TPA: efflux RND transporter periplasmic adaptor subunit [Terracidiphilus sp.]|nr:efflux RND transporter periplasmic adaptor subunit [Terracidiphilus sp.]
MNTRTYKLALGAAISLCIVLAATLAFVLLPRFHFNGPAPVQDPVVARGPDVNSNSTAQTGPASPGTQPALGPVQLSPRRMQQIGVTTATAAYKELKDTLQVPGNVDINEEKIAYVQTRFPGWIQKVFANATYQFVRKGQPLFTIYSPDLVSSQQEYLLARQNENAFASKTQGMAARESGWLTQAAEERLRQFGVAPQVVANLKKTGKVQREIEVDSPVSGYITERNALPNAYVQPETKIYTIADLSTVWVYANVFQNDVGRLRPGDRGQVTVDAYPGRSFAGRIDQILPQVDPTTRTVRVRLVFSNPGVLLKPGMYVNVTIQAPLGRHLVVPASAVLQAGSQSLVFVDQGNGYLQPRTVTVGPQAADDVVILSGVKVGDQVVSSASFLVDSEAQLQASAGGYAPLPAPQGQTSAASQAPQVRMDVQLSPSPARKGTNQVQVRVVGVDGKPVAGAEVEAVLFISAMPAMGMAAMHAAASLHDSGKGLYEGNVVLGSGGTWKLTITVRQGGKVIGTKQMSVDATGGMG